MAVEALFWMAALAALSAPGDPRAPIARELGLSPDAMNLTVADWNGQPVSFVDYLQGQEGEEKRHVIALLPAPDGTGRRVTVTIGEQEGGAPDVAAIGFANADRDPAREVIVILSWRVRHYDFEGTLYDIRILDDWKPGQDALVPVEKAERLFERYACDCNRRDGPDERATVKTIAAVRQTLKRAGY